MFEGANIWVLIPLAGIAAGMSLMARVGKDHYADSLAREHVREMDFTGPGVPRTFPLHAVARRESVRALD